MKNKKKNTPRQNIDNLFEFNSIYNLYKKEFIDCCENILIIEKNELLKKFFNKIDLIIKYIYLKDSKINNNLLSELKRKCQIKFISEVYTPMYNICSSTLNKFLSLKMLNGKIISKNGGITNQYLSNFLPHCLKEKAALHVCGNKFIQISNNNINYAICIWCKKCYFGNLIYMHCSYCNKNYFSKIIKINHINEEILYPATWEKYHCNLMKNEQMSCFKCDGKLWIKKNNLICKKCKFEIDPLDIFWTCTACQKDFKSPAKIYNSLEYREIKLKIRDALLYKKEIKPSLLPCKCIQEIDIDKYNFLHENNKGCNGVIYYTQLGNRHCAVCSSCFTMCPLNEFMWYCPICKKNFLASSVKIYDNKQKFEKIIYIDKNYNEEIKKYFYNKKNIKNFESLLKKSKKLKNLTNLEDSNNTTNDLFLSSIINGNNENYKNKYITSGINSHNISLSDRNTSDIKFIKTKNKKMNNILELLVKKEKKEKINHKNNISYNKCLSINNFNIKTNRFSVNNSFKIFNNKNLQNKKKIRNKKLNSRNNKNDYSIRFTTYNNSSFGKKSYIKGLSIIFNKNNRKSIFKINKKDISLNKMKKINSSAKQTKNNKKKIAPKKDKDVKEETKQKIINIINKNKITLLNFNLSKRLFTNYTNLIPCFEKIGKKNILKLIAGEKTNYSLRESNILKRKYEINKNSNNSKEKSNQKKNTSNQKVVKSYLKKENKIKRDLSFPQKLKLKNKEEKIKISNIKFKLKNTSEPKLPKKNNSILIKTINQNIHKRGNGKFNISEDLYYNRSSSLKSNRSNGSFSIMNNNQFKNNNSRINSKKKKYRNISPILKADNYTQTLLLNEKNSINSLGIKSLHKIKTNISSFLKYKMNKKENYNKILKAHKHNNSNIKKIKKNKKNSLIKNKKKKVIKKEEENIEEVKKSLNSTIDMKNINNIFLLNGSNKEEEKEEKIKEFNFDDYKIITQLGQGTFSKIYLVQDKNKNLFSMKKIILSDELDVISVIKEYKMCSKIKHENIVNLLGLYSSKLDKTTYVVYILMEVGKTDWEKEIRLLKEKQLNYSEKDLINIIKQLVSALSFLQKKNIVHRDIKPQNILIFKENKYKLADFGESKQLQNITFSLKNGSLRGTELYMSPLLFNGLRNGQIDVSHNAIKSDVYSLGLCLLYASTINNKSLYDIRKFIEMEGLSEYIEDSLNNKYSKALIDLIISMLEIHEEKRPNFIELEDILNKKF